MNVPGLMLVWTNEQRCCISGFTPHHTQTVLTWVTVARYTILVCIQQLRPAHTYGVSG